MHGRRMIPEPFGILDECKSKLEDNGWVVYTAISDGTKTKRLRVCSPAFLFSMPGQYWQLLSLGTILKLPIDSGRYF